MKEDEELGRKSRRETIDSFEAVSAHRFQVVSLQALIFLPHVQYRDLVVRDVELGRHDPVPSTRTCVHG